MFYNEEELAFKNNIRRLVERHVVPLIEESDANRRFPAELVPIFGDMGLLQLWVPEAYGGPGANLTMVAIAREEVARTSLAAAMLAANNSIGMVLPLLHFGSEAQRQRFLPMLSKGRTLSCVGMTEPHAGSDVAALRTRAIRDGDEYVINGQKSFITMGSVANWMLVFAKTDAEASRGVKNISAFLVDTKSPGFRVGRHERMVGMRSIPNVEIFFENLRVPVENMVGEEGKGFLASMKILDLNRPTVAAMALGLAQGALDIATEYAKERTTFGSPIGQHQAVQMLLADMAMQISAVRAMLYQLTRAVDGGDFSALTYMSSAVKCFATDVAMKVTTDAIQVLGGAGCTEDYKVERFFRDAKTLQINEGTNQIQRIVIARELLSGRAV